jgi:hypothetical protein
VAVVPYSSETQQPMRAATVLDRRPHMRWAAPGDREQGRAGSLHPEGQEVSSLYPPGACRPRGALGNMTAGSGELREGPVRLEPGL